VFFTAAGGFTAGENVFLNQIAGDMETPHRNAFEAGLPALLDLLPEADVWELCLNKKK
jgi:hypothetical protein